MGDEDNSNISDKSVCSWGKTFFYEENPRIGENKLDRTFERNMRLASWWQIKK